MSKRDDIWQTYTTNMNNIIEEAYELYKKGQLNMEIKYEDGNWSYIPKKERDYFDKQARENTIYGPVLTFLEEAYKNGIDKVYLSEEDIKALQEYRPITSDELELPFGIRIENWVGRYKRKVDIYTDGNN